MPVAVRTCLLCNVFDIFISRFYCPIHLWPIGYGVMMVDFELRALASIMPFLRFFALAVIIDKPWRQMMLCFMKQVTCAFVNFAYDVASSHLVK